jgi:hypothetical protein
MGQSARQRFGTDQLAAFLDERWHSHPFVGVFPEGVSNIRDDCKGSKGSTTQEEVKINVRLLRPPGYHARKAGPVEQPCTAIRKR